MKNKYRPFLKLKVNEIGALAELWPDLKKEVIPFLDLPKKENSDEEEFCISIQKAAKSVGKHLAKFQSFFLDNYDIDDALLVNGDDNYQFVVEAFRDLDFIPVLGLDRTPRHNQVVFDNVVAGNIKSSTAAIRLQQEDFETFELVEDQLRELMKQGHELFKSWTLVLDNRLCLNVDANRRSAELLRFIAKAKRKFSFAEIVVCGSSIPSSIGEIIAVQQELLHPRVELAIYRLVHQQQPHPNLYLGDYTVVSPLYSDIDIPKESMRNVTAPKIAYSFDNTHYVTRGGSLQRHARGALQYNDLAQALIAKPFYRGAPYSFGDNFLLEKSNFTGKQVTPSSILKPTINAHMTYMCLDFQV
ncbi:hypothetical protein V8G57_02605 [Collimonas sp. H4R21]|uniref:T4 beta protein n=1 Tax=Collimonas rhizosphaerae TaxID=3126357 RepID=A0ABU9PQI4_9BURK